MGAMAHCSTGGPNCQFSTVELIARSVTEFCGFVHDLVETRENVVCKLDFCDCGLPHTCLENLFIIKNMVTNPMPKATIPCSQRGVLNTLSFPYFLFKSKEHRKTPPNFTSSPKSTALLFIIFLVFRTFCRFLKQCPEHCLLLETYSSFKFLRYLKCLWELNTLLLKTFLELTLIYI